MNYLKLTIVGALALALTACGAQVKPVVLTDNLGNVYPYAVMVTYDGVAVTTGFTTQVKAEAYAAEVAKDKTKTVRLVESK